MRILRDAAVNGKLPIEIDAVKTLTNDVRLDARARERRTRCIREGGIRKLRSRAPAADRKQQPQVRMFCAKPAQLRKNSSLLCARVMTNVPFARLAERTTTFERHYVGSLPCMPARRDLQ